MQKEGPFQYSVFMSQVLQKLFSATSFCRRQLQGNFPFVVCAALWGSSAKQFLSERLCIYFVDLICVRPSLKLLCNWLQEVFFSFFRFLKNRINDITIMYVIAQIVIQNNHWFELYTKSCSHGGLVGKKCRVKWMWHFLLKLLYIKNKRIKLWVMKHLIVISFSWTLSSTELVDCFL